jgi:puromycin-sensitive aminopeptidase
MIEQFIGEDAFRAGVGNYLRRHAYGNTVTADLWAGLDEASEYPVGEIMNPWIHQRGFPQVEVSKTTSGLRFQQRRFFYLPDETDSTLWKVPIQVRGLRSGTEFWEKTLLSEVEATIEVGEVTLAVANAGGHGFYRVLYSPELIEEIVAHLPELEDLERFTIIDDAAAFVDSGQLSAADWMRLAEAYRGETEQAIWGSLLGGAAEIEHHLVEEETRPAFQAWVEKLVGPAFRKLGWKAQPGESDLTRRLRGQLASALGRLAHDPDVIERCASLADQVLSDSRSIDPELAQAALLVTAHHGGEVQYHRFLEEYPKTRAPHEQQRLLLALAAFDHPVLVAETVDASLDGRIRTQDSAWVIGATLRNRINGPLAWKRLRNRWDNFVKLPTMTQRRAIEGIKSLSRPEVAAEVEAFFAETKLPHAAKSIAQNLEMLRVLVELRERETKSVKEFLAS